MWPENKPLKMPETTTPTTVGTGPAPVDAVVSQPSGDSANPADGSNQQDSGEKERGQSPLLHRRVARLRPIPLTDRRMSHHGQDQARGCSLPTERPVRRRPELSAALHARAPATNPRRAQ